MFVIRDDDGNAKAASIMKRRNQTKGLMNKAIAGKCVINLCTFFAILKTRTSEMTKFEIGT